MALPTYQILVIDTTGEVIRVLDPILFDEMRYSILLNDIGKIAITLRDTEDYSQVFGLDHFIEVYRADPVTDQLSKEETYFTRLLHRFSEEDEGYWVVGGVSLNHLLRRRVIDPEDDPNVAGGYSTKGGPADTIIREYIREQCGSLASTARQFPSFSVSAVGGTGGSAGARARYENLLEVVQQLARKGAVDFAVERIEGNTLLCRIGMFGEDKTIDNAPGPYIGISPQRGNIRNPSYMEDRIDEKTFVYTMGQGQEENRVLLKIPGAALGDSPYNRIEYVYDARRAEDALELQTEGESSLEENRGKIEFKFEMESQTSGTSYKEDWIIGDRITGIWDGIEQNLRITGVEINISSQGETISPLMENI